MNTTSTGIVPTFPINNDGFFGGEGIWIVILLALMFGNNGFGFGNNGYGNLATQDYVSSEFTQRDITNGFQNQSNLISGGFSNLAQDISGLNTSILENRYAGQLSACNTQRDILTQTNELNTNLLTTALNAQAKLDECCCSIKAQGIENTQKILDAMSQATIDSLRSEVNDLKNTITANGIGSTIINSVRPYPVPSYLVSSPYQSLYNGFYGAGFYGNTIV